MTEVSRNRRKYDKTRDIFEILNEINNKLDMLIADRKGWTLKI